MILFKLKLLYLGTMVSFLLLTIQKYYYQKLPLHHEQIRNFSYTLLCVTEVTQKLNGLLLLDIAFMVRIHILTFFTALNIQLNAITLSLTAADHRNNLAYYEYG